MNIGLIKADGKMNKCADLGQHCDDEVDKLLQLKWLKAFLVR